MVAVSSASLSNFSSSAAPRGLFPARGKRLICSFSSQWLRESAFASVSSSSFLSGYRGFSSLHLDCPVRSITSSRSLSVRAMAEVNAASLAAYLNQSWEVLAEPIQNVMRRYGVPEPYEKLKELTRGRAVNRESIREFIEGLNIPIEAKTALLELTPHTYVGAAIELARNVENIISLVIGAQIF